MPGIGGIPNGGNPGGGIEGFMATGGGLGACPDSFLQNIQSAQSFGRT